MSVCQEKWLHCILLLARPHVYIGSCMCLTWKANSCDEEHYVKHIIIFCTAATAASVVTATASAAATGTGNGTDADVPTTTTTITATTKCWLWCFKLHNFLLHVFFKFRSMISNEFNLLTKWPRELAKYHGHWDFSGILLEGGVGGCVYVDTPVCSAVLL